MNKKPEKHPKISQEPDDLVDTIYCDSKSFDNKYPELLRPQPRYTPEPPII